jgi:cell division protein FtsB
VKALWSSISEWLVETIYTPKRVLLLCSVAVACGLVFDGTLIKIWRLQRNIETFEVKTQKYQEKIEIVREQVQRSNDPEFLERQARDRFDLVNEGDLVFVFSEPNESAN